MEIKWKSNGNQMEIKWKSNGNKIKLKIRRQENMKIKDWALPESGLLLWMMAQKLYIIHHSITSNFTKKKRGYFIVDIY